MSIRDCIEKLVAAGQVTRKIADDAMGLYERMNSRYSAEMPPAAGEAAAALATARALRSASDAKAFQIAHNVRAWRDMEARIVEHPYGRSAGLMAMFTKDFWRSGQMFRDLAPESLVKQGRNVEYMGNSIRSDLYNKFRAGMDAYKPGFFNNDAKIQGVRNMVHEIFGSDTGDQVAKTAAAGWNAAVDSAVVKAKGAGKIFNELDDWRMPQHWEASRVRKFTEDEYVSTYTKELQQDNIKVFNKDTGKEVETAAELNFVLKRAYNDIISEGGKGAPFSQEIRTFRFNEGTEGASSFLRMQEKFGVGNEVLSMMAGHLDHMAREISLSTIMGTNHQATFAAGMRLVKQSPEIPIGPGAEKYNPARLIAKPFQTEAMLRNTYKVITGQADIIRSELLASVMGGARDLIGASSLRNLPITIMPSDTATTMLASNWMGMSGMKVLGEIADGATSKEAAAHLQINSHSAMDYVFNTYRKYEDELNVAGSARKYSRAVVAATGAEWWTTNGRRSAQTSIMNQLAEARGFTFEKLDPNIRKFLGDYGFDAKQWDNIRAADPIEIGNGAKYYIDPDKMDPALFGRLLNAAQEQSAFMFHQPDARSRAVTTGGTDRGTASGEVWRSFMQYKQFASERMTTHMMRLLIDGDITNRFYRGTAFMALTTAAGALSLQAASIVAGKDPMDMSNPKFWAESFIKGGAGGIYGDLLAAGLRGDRSASEVGAQMMGPLPGLAADVVRLATAPARAHLDESGASKKETMGREFAQLGSRNTPSTWYTRLVVDRLFWNNLQKLIDPDYQGSFRRAEDRARRQGSGFWWGPGESSPTRTPNLGNAVGH